MTIESSTRDDLGERRAAKAAQNAAQDKEGIWQELAKAVAALKDAERNTLRAQILMERSGYGAEEGAAQLLRDSARVCETTAGVIYTLVRLIGNELGREDPFTPPPGQGQN